MRIIVPISRFGGGISYSEKEGIKSSFVFARSVDYRTDPTKLKLLPRATKISGTVVTDLIMDGDRYSADTYFYGDSGNIYKKTSADALTNLVTIPDSHGNGMKYFGEDGYLYYASDTVIGRYGHMTGTPSFSNDFLGSEGGAPTNLASLLCASASSEYATAADSASLSITSDLTLEAYVNFTTLPAVGAEQTFVSKWLQFGNVRSYYFGIYGISGYFGDGAEGALTISSNTTQAPTDSACTGTAGASTLTATNASFATGQKVLIHQSRGTGAGKWERNEIAGYTAGTITLTNALINSYTSGAQVIVYPEYTNVTVNASKTWTAKSWNGTVGGILLFLATGTVTVNGSIVANGTNGTNGVNEANGVETTGGGFYGGENEQGGQQGYQGEGTAGAKAASSAANGNGGGGGYENGTSETWGSGGGGGNGAAGSNGSHGGGGSTGSGGTGGAAAGTADLTTMVFGGGGGAGAVRTSEQGGAGGSGGGIIFITGVTLTMGAAGYITSNGGNGGNPSLLSGGGGGGAGGSILLKVQTATLGTTRVKATGGSAGTGGGAGAVGRIHIDYYTSYTGTTSPTLDYTQDNNLVTTTAYQIRLGISTNGTAEEYLARTLTTNPNTSQWYHYAVTWDASGALATFYLDGNSIGTATGTATSINNNASLFAIGASFNSVDPGAAENFLNGKIDEVRVWNDIRSAAEIYIYKDVELVGTEANLQGYWTLDNDDDDITANNNDLTLVNTPTYSTSVPFSAPTTRRDLDQGLDTSGQVYALATAINEAADHRQTFVPAKDPQKSVQINISDTGDDSNWTLTVHDALNRTVASKTIVHADLTTGDVEFIFSSVWRPIIGASYHFHVTATTTTGDPAIVTTTNADCETADFHTYYQFLVDCNYHPMEQMLNFLAIGNERYLATYDAITYSPHKITLPAGYTIRCLAKWREYLAIGCMLGSNITDYDYGVIFFWDGISTTYNFYVDIPQGAINSMMSGDPLYFLAGYTADLMKYAGGYPDKVLRMPKVKDTVTVEFNRKSLAMWRALVHIGMAENSTSTDIERGIYSYGTINKELPETLSFDYPLSIGLTTGATIEVGMLMPIGSSLYVSWRSGSGYGVDKIALTNAPAASGTCEFLITDVDKIYQEKQAHVLRGYFKALTSGDTMKLKYKIDRESSWTEGTAETTALVKETRLTLPTMSNRFNEFQAAVDITTTNTTSPEFYGLGMDIEEMTRERRT